MFLMYVFYEYDTELDFMVSYGIGLILYCIFYLIILIIDFSDDCNVLFCVRNVCIVICIKIELIDEMIYDVVKCEKLFDNLFMNKWWNDDWLEIIWMCFVLLMWKCVLMCMW